TERMSCCDTPLVMRVPIGRCHIGLRLRLHGGLLPPRSIVARATRIVLVAPFNKGPSRAATGERSRAAGAFAQQPRRDQARATAQMVCHSSGRSDLLTSSGTNGIVAPLQFTEATPSDGQTTYFWATARR